MSSTLVATEEPRLQVGKFLSIQRARVKQLLEVLQFLQALLGCAPFLLFSTFLQLVHSAVCGMGLMSALRQNMFQPLALTPAAMTLATVTLAAVIA